MWTHGSSEMSCSASWLSLQILSYLSLSVKMFAASLTGKWAPLHPSLLGSRAFTTGHISGSRGLPSGLRGTWKFVHCLSAADCNMWFLTQRQALVRYSFFGTFMSLLKPPKKRLGDIKPKSSSLREPRLPSRGAVPASQEWQPSYRPLKGQCPTHQT